MYRFHKSQSWLNLECESAVPFWWIKERNKQNKGIKPCILEGEFNMSVHNILKKLTFHYQCCLLIQVQNSLFYCALFWIWWRTREWQEMAEWETETISWDCLWTVYWASQNIRSKGNLSQKRCPVHLLQRLPSWSCWRILRECNNILHVKTFQWNSKWDSSNKVATLW